MSNVVPIRRRVQKIIPIELTEEQIASKDRKIRELLAETCETRRDIEMFSRPKRKVIAENEKLIKQLTRHSNTGYESKETDCIEILDSENDLVIYELHKKVLWTRPMNEEEREEARQLLLDIKNEDEEGNLKIEDDYKVKKQCVQCDVEEMMYQKQYICVTCKKREEWRYTEQNG